MNQQSQSLSPARSRKCAVYRMVLAAMFACLAFVLNTFVYFPAMAPFQHFVDVIAAVTLGPWYACAAAFICGILRMLSGRTVQAVTGAVFGPILGGLLYRRFHSLWAAALGEVIGTGFFHRILPADEVVLRTGCRVTLLLHTVLYPICRHGCSHGRRSTSDSTPCRSIQPDAAGTEPIAETEPIADTELIKGEYNGKV